MTLDMLHVQPILNALLLGYLVSQHLFEKDCGFADFFVKRFARQRCVRRSGKNLNMVPKHLYHAHGFPAARGHVLLFSCTGNQVVGRTRCAELLLAAVTKSLASVLMRVSLTCLWRFHQGIQPCNYSGREALFLLVDPKKMNEPLDFLISVSPVRWLIALVPKCCSSHGHIHNLLAELVQCFATTYWRTCCC